MTGWNAVTTTGAATVLPDSAIKGLRESMRGDVLGPGSEGYDDARTLWNAVHYRRPAVVARCAEASDVVAAVNFACKHGIPVAVRGGGHNVAGSGSCDGGL